jgi:membrane associated rhomboid family serine protease
MAFSKSSKGAVWLLFFSAFFSGASFALMIADLNHVEQSGYFLLQGASGILFGLLAVWQVKELLHSMNASNTNGTYYGDN